LTKSKGSKKGYHTHFCLRIVPQGTWKEAERRELRMKMEEYRNTLTKTSGSDYHFFDKLTRIVKRPTGNYCNLCEPLFDIFEKKDPNLETLLYLGHHYVFLEEDQPEMITLVKMLRDDPKVKKFQILYLDSLSEMKTTDISAMRASDLRDFISHKQLKISDIIDILKEGKFEIRTLYEVHRDSYY
jgi:hypothetical protein